MIKHLLEKGSFSKIKYSIDDFLFKISKVILFILQKLFSFIQQLIVEIKFHFQLLSSYVLGYV